MRRTIERELLYRQVWTTPMTKLCQQYGLSDNGLRKICKALRVPTPSAGYWMKLQAGKQVAVIPLPTETPRSSYILDSSYQRERGVSLRAEIASELKAKIASDAMAPIVVGGSDQTRWHKEMSPIRKRVREQRAYWKQKESEFNAIERRRKAGFPPEIGGHVWRSFLESGGLLFPQHQRFVMKVSDSACDRSLELLNAICLWATRSGYKPGLLGEQCEALIIQQGDASVSVRILEKRLVSLQRDDGVFYRHTGGMKKVSQPSGLLKIHASSRYGVERIFEEPANPSSHDLLSKVFVYIHKAIAGIQERSRAEAEAAIVREELRRVRAVEQAVRDAELQRVAAEEAERYRLEQVEISREAALLGDVQQWRQAADLRLYIQAVEQSTDESVSEPKLEAWLLWARGVLARLDPVPRLLMDLREESSPGL